VLEQIRTSGAKRDWSRVDKLTGQELRRPGGTPALNDDLKAIQAVARRSHAVEQLLPALTVETAPDVGVLERQLADLQTATGDKDLVRDVKEFLGVDALLHGHPEEAKKLLPPGWEKEDPRNLLRDMKKRLESKYPSTPGEGTAPPKVGPVPQPNNEGVRPSVKEKPGEGLPPLEEEVNTDERVCRERLTVGLRQYAAVPLPSLYLALDRLRRHARDEADEEEAGREAEVARLLGRGLEPSERVLVGVMHRQGKKPDEMADVLRRLVTDNAKP
jgi:hypothetical protein